jgi:two-component system, NtrC family, response regulator HydG
MTRILVVDDEPGFRRSLAITLRREGYDVAEASGGGDAIDQLGRHETALIITDLKMQDMSGLQLLEHVKGASPSTEVIVMTAYGTIEIAVEAMRGGAYDFVTKPFQLEEILHRTRNALERRRLRREVHALRVEATKTRALSNIVGVSLATQELRGLIPRVAQVDSAVLVTGESGTGKELVARAIHESSRRATGPFVAVSCAALPVELLESELFGHVKGAFTGAHTNRMGLFEEASGGTLLLDEVGEAPLAIQAKLLRALEERTIRRVGDNRSIPVDIRVVAATNVDLTAALGSKLFREDLYFRLNVIRMRLSPLRERPDDIPVLARHFLARHASRAGRTFDGIAPEAMEALGRYRFQGNVRELSNIVEEAVALATGVLLELDDLPDDVRVGAAVGDPEAPGARRPLDAMERELILARLRLHGGDLQAVAADLRMSRTTLWRRMKQYRIEANP